jgi:hypothetical protein
LLRVEFQTRFQATSLGLEDLAIQIEGGLWIR